MNEKQYQERVKEIGDNLPETMASHAITIKKLVELEEFEKAEEVKKLSIKQLIHYSQMILDKKDEQENFSSKLISIFTQMINSEI